MTARFISETSWFVVTENGQRYPLPQAWPPTPVLAPRLSLRLDGSVYFVTYVSPLKHSDAFVGVTVHYDGLDINTVAIGESFQIQRDLSS